MLKYEPCLIRESVATQVLELLTLCDQDFLPPLSSRTSTTQKELQNSPVSAAPVAYFEELKRQPCLLWEEDGKIVGMLSWREEGIPLSSLYLTTLAVHPDYRGRGIAKKLYQGVFRMFPRQVIEARTWSTNEAQVHLFQSLGFQETIRLFNNRGKGIDTVYYLRKPEGANSSAILRSAPVGA